MENFFKLNYILKKSTVTIPCNQCKLALFEKMNHSICVTRDRCSLKKSCRAKTVSWVFLSKTPIVNVTLMGEVLQNRFSLFMQKNVCTGDIVCQKMQEDGLQIRRKWGGSVGVFGPLDIPISGTPTYTKDPAVGTKQFSVECTVNDNRVQTPCKNPSTYTNIKLPVFFSLRKSKAKYILCRKQSNVLRPLKSLHAILLIVAYMSLIVNKKHIKFMALKKVN